MAERIKRERTEPEPGERPPDDAEDKAEDESNLENGDSGLEAL
jgi:hypothetical protein